MLDFKKIGKKNICLIGLMGSGKTVIAKELSKMHNLKVYDSDNEIEKNENQNINSIFQNQGEKYFREIEEKICLKLLYNENCIISLGGGSIINKKIRKAIEDNSYSIYLQVKLKNLLNRLKSSNKRPLLDKKLNKKEILENLYKDRRIFYEKANFIVNNDNDKFRVLEEIKSELNLYAK